LYFSHTQVIKTSPLKIRLRSLVMPAILQRLEIESQVRQPDKESDWNLPNSNRMAEVIEPGAIQFLDGSFYLGQASQIITDSQIIPNLTKREAES
jgi:hypothetical protein